MCIEHLLCARLLAAKKLQYCEEWQASGSHSSVHRVVVLVLLTYWLSNKSAQNIMTSNNQQQFASHTLSGSGIWAVLTQGVSCGFNPAMARTETAGDWSKWWLTWWLTSLVYIPLCRPRASPCGLLTT